MAKLTRDGGHWRLHAIGEGIAVTVPTESVAALRPYL
jgi:tellurium resistance protein TerZ